MLRVNEVSVQGLFGGKGTVTGTLLSGAVYRGDRLTVRGKKTKPYIVTAVFHDGDAVRLAEGTPIRLEIKGIKKKDLVYGDILCGDPEGKHCPLTDIYDYAARHAYCLDVANYFAEVFARYFPDYDIRRGETIQGESGEPIRVDFLFYRGGTPCLAIFLRDNTEWKKKEAAYLQRVCQGQGIKRLNFISNFQNKVEYVRDRVSGELG